MLKGIPVWRHAVAPSGRSVALEVLAFSVDDAADRTVPKDLVSTTAARTAGGSRREHRHLALEKPSRAVMTLQRISSFRCSLGSLGIAETLCSRTFALLIHNRRRTDKLL